jgi:hypothetical protein
MSELTVFFKSYTAQAKHLKRAEALEKLMHKKKADSSFAVFSPKFP